MARRHGWTENGTVRVSMFSWIYFLVYNVGWSNIFLSSVKLVLDIHFEGLNLIIILNHPEESKDGEWPIQG